MKALWLTLTLTLASCCSALATETVVFTPAEQNIISAMQWDKRKPIEDPSNRYAQNPDAQALGKALFFDRRLSADGRFACADCHQPDLQWANGQALADLRGIPTKRHVPSLWNTAYNRWFFWDGRADSLWSQAIDSLEQSAELAGDRTALVRLLVTDPTLAKRYQTVFGDFPLGLAIANLPLAAKPAPSAQRDPQAESAYQAWNALAPDKQDAINRVLSNATKAIAAFETTLISGETPFDQFAHALAQGQTSNALSLSAQNGLKVFLQAGCVNCHSGPRFSDGEFHHIFFQPQQADMGRADGINRLLVNPFNTLGAYSDGIGEHDKLAYVYKSVAFRWAFKTPSLRNVALTAPYMHTGQMPTLEAVIDYYNQAFKQDTTTEYQETLVNPLRLTATDKQDLIAFLQALSPINH